MIQRQAPVCDQYFIQRIQVMQTCACFSHGGMLSIVRCVLQKSALSWGKQELLAFLLMFIQHRMQKHPLDMNAHVFYTRLDGLPTSNLNARFNQPVSDRSARCFHQTVHRARKLHLRNLFLQRSFPWKMAQQPPEQYSTSL